MSSSPSASPQLSHAVFLFTDTNNLSTKAVKQPCSDLIPDGDARSHCCSRALCLQLSAIAPLVFLWIPVNQRCQHTQTRVSELTAGPHYIVTLSHSVSHLLFYILFVSYRIPVYDLSQSSRLPTDFHFLK